MPILSQLKEATLGVQFGGAKVAYFQKIPPSEHSNLAETPER